MDECHFPSVLDRGAEIDYQRSYPKVVQLVLFGMNPRAASATRALLRLTLCH